MSRKLGFILVSLKIAAVSSYLYTAGLYKFGFILIGTLIIAAAISSYMFVRLYEDSRVIHKLVSFLLFEISGLMVLSFFPTLGLSSKVVFIAVISLISYLYMLSINVYMVSERQGESIPLLEPAKVMVSISQVVTVFFMSLIVYKSVFFINSGLVDVLIKMSLFGVLFFLLIKTGRWFFLSGRAGEDAEKELASISAFRMLETVLLLQLAWVLTLYPYEDIGRAALLSGFYYVGNNFIQNHLNRKITARTYIESSVLLGIIFFLIFFL